MSMSGMIPAEGGVPLKKRSLAIGLAVLLCLAGGALAQDQDQDSYIWINFLTAQPGQGDALTQLLIEEDTKTFDPLVESGAAVGWGVAMPVVHDEDVSFTHVEWISFVGWAGADAFMGKFMEMQQAKSEEQRKAEAEKWETLRVRGSHYDSINRSIHVGQAQGGRPGYIHLGYYTAKVGKMDDAKSFYDDVAVPVYDKLVADGKILNYGLHVQAVHRDQTWTHMGWYSSNNLAARDDVGAAFDAAGEARSEEENAEIGKRWAEVFVPEAHSDQILLVVHYKSASGDGE
jgi:hypothetical protein